MVFQEECCLRTRPDWDCGSMGVWEGKVALPGPVPNNPVERTAHSAGSVSIPGSVPVGRRSQGALDAKAGEVIVDKEEREYIRDLTAHAIETVHFLSNAQKSERERCVCAAFLRCVGVAFSVEALVAVAEKQSPPDVKFGEARFEICEVLNRDRKRHREAQTRVESLKQAKTIDDVLVSVRTGTPLSYTEVFTLVTEALAKKAVRYGAKVCAELDALIYMSLRNRFLAPNTSLPGYAALCAQGWRSVAFVIPPFSHVIYAAESSPAFLRDFSGQTRQEWDDPDTFFTL